MTKNTILSISLGAAVLVSGFFAFNAYIRHEELTPSNPSEAGTVTPATPVSIEKLGTIVGIDMEQAKVDGPILLTIKDENGLSSTVALPARGLGLCAAKATIAAGYDAKVGDRIEVKGTVDENGRIVPCSAVDDYFRLSASRKVVGDGQSTLDPLFGTSWVWQKTTLHKGDVVLAPKGDRFVLSFGEDKRMHSTTDCNALSGTYAQNGEVLSFGPMMSTKMFCEGSSEGVYGEELALTNSYTIAGDELHLNLNRDFGTMIFIKKQ